VSRIYCWLREIQSPWTKQIPTCSTTSLFAFSGTASVQAYRCLPNVGVGVGEANRALKGGELTSCLSAFRSYPEVHLPMVRRRLGKSCDSEGLGSRLLIPPGSKYTLAWRSQRLVSVFSHPTQQVTTLLGEETVGIVCCVGPNDNLKNTERDLGGGAKATLSHSFVPPWFCMVI
jgi:hypothetical protein